METMGQRICRTRKSRKMTQQELSERASVARNTLSQWETSARAKIPAEVIAPIAIALGVSADELLTGRRAAADRHPCAQRPDWFRDLCQEWDTLPAVTQDMLEASARAAIKSRPPAPLAHRARDGPPAARTG